MIRSKVKDILIELTNDDLAEILKVSAKDADLDDFEDFAATGSKILQWVFFQDVGV